MTSHMDETSHEFHHGEMPVAAQEHTYVNFNRLAKWFSLHVAVLVFVLTLWFCVGVGFIAGLIPGLILLGLGIAFLRSKPPEIHP